MSQFNENIGTEAHYDFDINEVCRRLGEPVPEGDDQSQQVALVLSVLKWLVPVGINSKDFLKSVGMRTVAMAWVIDPSLFKGDSLRSISTQLGFNAANISPFTAEFSRLTGLRNNFQNHDWRKAAK